MKAFVLMTAMPPTTGHWQLIQFASLLAPKVHVIVSTQPFEPFPQKRVQALREAVKNRMDPRKVTIHHMDTVVEQDPNTPGFKEMWQKILRSYGCGKGDIVVASEAYGQWLARTVGATFYPYDIDRTLNDVKATPIRDNTIKRFDQILPEFQKYLQTTVTIFGAESTGKTTLSKELAKQLHAQWLFEYARPYLENTVNDITVESMTAIWKGQAALQKQAANLGPNPIVIQDTDLYTTVGYWQFPQWHALIGNCPARLRDDAKTLQSDLYIVTKSNIPFEKDPLRYGGDKREGSDNYWIALCEYYHLPYIVLETNDPQARVKEAVKYVKRVAAAKAKLLQYDRRGF